MDGSRRLRGCRRLQVLGLLDGSRDADRPRNDGDGSQSLEDQTRRDVDHDASRRGRRPAGGSYGDREHPAQEREVLMIRAVAGRTARSERGYILATVLVFLV